jgi:carboxyl-terminal processing protease
LAASALLLLSACSIGGLGGPESTGHLTRDMFVTAFNDMDAVYIREPDLAKVTLDSLDQLHQLDNAVTVRRTGDRVELLRDSAIIASHPVDDDFSATEWGEITGETLDQAIVASPIIKATATEAIFETMLTPAVKNLDDFSRYSGADVAAENRASRDGFGGIGVRISVEDDSVLVTSVMHYTPAERMGLKRDDRIVEIDGISTKGMTQAAVVDRPVDNKSRSRCAGTGR